MAGPVFRVLTCEDTADPVTPDQQAICPPYQMGAVTQYQKPVIVQAYLVEGQQQLFDPAAASFIFLASFVLPLVFYAVSRPFGDVLALIGGRR